jgi:hypothetical protein
MTNFFKTIFTIVVVILVVDFFCFIGWAMSGQKPVDNFYFGTISAHIISSVIK